MAIMNRDVLHENLYHSINSRPICEISQELEQYCLSELQIAGQKAGWVYEMMKIPAGTIDSHG